MQGVGEFFANRPCDDEGPNAAGVDHFVDNRSAVVIRDSVPCDLSVGSDTGTMGCRIGLPEEPVPGLQGNALGQDDLTDCCLG